MSGLSALSDALIGLRRWSDPEVLAERNIVLGAQTAEYTKYLEEYRERARDRILKAFQYVKAAEREAFEINSFFVQRDEEISSLSSLPSDSDMD